MCSSRDVPYSRKFCAIHSLDNALCCLPEGIHVSVWPEGSLGYTIRLRHPRNSHIVESDL